MNRARASSLSPLGSAHHEINLTTVAAGARKASAPVDDRRLGAVTLRHFAGAGLYLMAAIETSHNQANAGGRGVAERHGWPAVGLYPRRRRLPAADGASRVCNGGADPDGGCGGLSFARIAFNGASRGESG